MLKKLVVMCLVVVGACKADKTAPPPKQPAAASAEKQAAKPEAPPKLTINTPPEWKGDKCYAECIAREPTQGGIFENPTAEEVGAYCEYECSDPP